MSSLSSILHLHRKNPSRDKDKEEDVLKTKSKPPLSPPPSSKQSPPPAYLGTSPVPPPLPTVSQPTAPLFAPGTGPLAHSQMVQANNIGMLGGAVIGSALGESPVTGMLEGQVGANMIMQRVQQEQRHLYYREQALRYREGLPADGVGAAGGLAPAPVSGGRDRSRSRSQRRDEKRKARWERRAKRRDGGGGGNEASGTDSE